MTKLGQFHVDKKIYLGISYEISLLEKQKISTESPNHHCRYIQVGDPDRKMSICLTDYIFSSD